MNHGPDCKHEEHSAQAFSEMRQAIIDDSGPAIRPIRDAVKMLLASLPPGFNAEEVPPYEARKAVEMYIIALGILLGWYSPRGCPAYLEQAEVVLKVIKEATELKKMATEKGTNLFNNF